MERKFRDVFSNLQLDKDLSNIVDKAVIERVSINSDKSAARIYLRFASIVPKRRVFKLEEQIQSQYFANVETRIHIIESFSLSSLYTPANFYDAYKDSIYEELQAYSHLVLHIFKKSDLNFSDDNHLNLCMEDSPIARKFQNEIHDILFKIFNERAGFSVIIDISYKQAQPSKYLANAKADMDDRLSEIARQTTRKQNEEHLLEEEKIEKTDETDKPKSLKQKVTKNTSHPLTKSDHPDVLYGKNFDGELLPISEMMEGLGPVCVRGKILGVESRELKSGRAIVKFTLTDFTDTITSKIFVEQTQIDEMEKKLSPGSFIKIKATPTMDSFDHDLVLMSVYGIMSVPDFTKKRADHAPKKRVELHLHTKMSDMDGVTDVEDLMKRADAWGHSAMAITDHGVVQSFPKAEHTLHALKNPDFKLIYGCEIYLVDDTKGVVTGAKGQSLDQPYVVFDLETTGFIPGENKIIEIGAVRIENGEIVSRFSEYVNPREPIPYRITELTSISDEDVIGAPSIEEILPAFLQFCEGAVMVAHNAGFDMSFIEYDCNRLSYVCPQTYLDTVALSRFLLPSLTKYKLDNVAKALGVPLGHHHRAVDDAECTALIFVKFIEMLKERGLVDLDLVNEAAHADEEVIKKMPSYHCIVLAKNDIGRINLYRLVSASHLQYFYRRPKVPKSLLNQYREGLIVGSACEAGELFQAVYRKSSEREIARIVGFYDYLEIQPIGNNAFYLRDESSSIHTEEDLREINRRIVHLGERFHKPVVATCDVHFLDPEDEVYRRIIMSGKGFDDADEQAPLYLRTTEEMLEEFSYLGDKKAEEVVITNTNLIADMVEPISPVRPDKCPPVIENSDEILREICYDKAHQVYGEQLPEIVEERLERELNSIIGNGYAVMYIIAQKLVWKSNEDGYLVGSRGSVGSSFAATMAGITEVNPLPAHYICSNCHYVDFDSDVVKEYAGRAGCDLPDKNCPVCGKKLKKEGFDIPFETFLGFSGNKEPDIDLNFSGDYQAKAHKYTEVIFGEGQTFKAGTIGTLADKTAYGYTKRYYEEHNQRKRDSEINRIVAGCVGVKRATGQHPGGIIVLPVGEDINTFTPVQYPANDKDSGVVTTHFDYHSIDSNLLKLDILGHDDPTMIRMLEDLTGLKAEDIPLDDKKVMSLFMGTEALGITPDDIMGTFMGTLGVPEFGTDFAMGMLRDAKPKEFSDLICIAGLAHGTDVWLGNAQTLIEEGVATISTCISTRDGIMTYLIHMGLDSEEAFKIMESTRKGIIAKGKEPKWEQYQKDMREHGVPDWYIASCEKIKYMFPKAHAAAYVMMAWRIAYYKVYHPLAYYAAFFSIRATAFNYEMMCFGKERVEQHIKEIQKMERPTAKDKDTLRDLRVVQEMYARGFTFLPLDLYHSDAKYFQIVDGKLLPPFNSIEGMGDKASESLAIAAASGTFLSRDDLQERSKIGKSLMELLGEIGILDDLPESNQLSLFDF